MKQNAINHINVCFFVCVFVYVEGYYLEIKKNIRQLKDGNTQLYIESGCNKIKRFVWLRRIKLLRFFYYSFFYVYKLCAKRSGNLLKPNGE